MFNGMKNMISISFTKLFNTEKKEDLINMFKNCLSLKSIDISGFKTEDIKDLMAYSPDALHQNQFPYLILIQKMLKI